MLRKALLSLCCIMFTLPAYSYQVGGTIGKGDHNHMLGGRLFLRSQWAKEWFKQSSWNLKGYWEASLAYWSTDTNKNKAIGIFAFSPVIRLQKATPWFGNAKPYFEIACGPSALSASHVGTRDLGASWAFQDQLGMGFQFGSQGQYDLSYHYIHYSNAGFALPNAGIDVPYTVSFSVSV